jgi:hypothetical protein
MDEEEIDDMTWYARLGRRMQKDLIDCLDISWSGYYEILPEDAKRAREFYLSCQVK